MGSMKIDSLTSVKRVKPDNLYDMLFDHTGKPKQNSNKKLVFDGDRLDFLDNEGANIKFVESANKEVEIDKMKISKQFKLVNPVPRFESIPATPQFFDLAGTYITYPDLTEPLTKYKETGGLFKKLTGFFGR